MQMRRISDMVRNKNPVMLPKTATVEHACQCMRDRRVGAVMVTDKQGRLVGLFTGRDAVERVLAEGLDAATARLADVMTPDPAALAPEQTAIEALRLMQDGGFRHVPVVDSGRVVSILSRGDFRGIEQARLDEETGLWERI